MKKMIALLPMKSHSERVINKNIRPFAGRPLYHRIAETLESCSYVKEIIINTDSEKIADEAPKLFPKVRIVKRPKELCGDFIAMNNIIANDINLSDSEHFLQTHSTNPLLTKKTLERSIKTYFKNIDVHDSLFSVNRIQTRFYWKSGVPVNHDPARLIRTQDLEALFEENSNIYIFSKSSFLMSGNQRIGMNPVMFEMNKLEAVDIDDEEDFLIAEMLFKRQGLK